MSSTSLSSCDHTEYCQCSCFFEDSFGRVYQPGPATPFYKTMGQPQVYYAQLQPRDRPKRAGNKNCFVKAFQWYTKDFGEMPKQDSRVSPDVRGFACWLESKYGEYLSENEAIQIAQNLQSRRVSTIDTASCPPCPTSSAKRRPRMKSPWRKRKSASPNAGDMSCKSKSSNASCHFILQPQDLTRPGSECYQNQITCPSKCLATVMSNEAIATQKTVVKSRSMTSIDHETVTQNRIDVITAQEGPTNIPRNSCVQKCKTDIKIQPQYKTEYENVEEILICMPQKSQVPCKQIRQMEPCKKVQQLCDQTCRFKQNFEMGAQMHPIPLQSQKIETHCDDGRIYKQAYKITQEDDQMATTSQLQMTCEKNCTTLPRLQKVEIPCDQIKDCKLVQNLKSYDKDTPCDQNCLIKDNCNVLQEMRGVPIKFYDVDSCGRSSVETLARNLQQKSLNKQEYKITTESEQISSTTQLLTTPCAQDIAFKQVYTGQGRSAKIENPELPCNRSCPMNQNNVVKELQGSTQASTQAHRTDFPCVLINNSKQRGTKPRKMQEPLKLRSSKVNNECQCPDDVDVAPSTIESCDPTCPYVLYGGIAPVHVQTQQNERMSRQYLPNKPKPPISYYFKKPRTSKVDVSCQCSENITQRDTGPLEHPQAKIKANVAYYPHRTSSNKTDVSCQCSESEIIHTVRMYERRPQAKSLEKVTEISCQCPDHDILQYNSYKQNYIEPSDAVCVCPKPRPVKPVCHSQGTDSYTRKNIVHVRKTTHSLIAFRSGSVQTSNHSINLERDDVQGYAFFMKIVCADKLNG